MILSKGLQNLIGTKVTKINFAAGLQPVHVKHLLLPRHEDPNAQDTRCFSHERSLVPHAYTQSRVFRALLVIHNPRYDGDVLDFIMHVS